MENGVISLCLFGKFAKGYFCSVWSRASPGPPSTILSVKKSIATVCHFPRERCVDFEHKPEGQQTGLPSLLSGLNGVCCSVLELKRFTANL